MGDTLIQSNSCYIKGPLQVHSKCDANSPVFFTLKLFVATSFNGQNEKSIESGNSSTCSGKVAKECWYKSVPLMSKLNVPNDVWNSMTSW